MDSPVADEKEGGRPTKKTQGDRPFTKRDREKFITRQPPIGEKDDYDNENKQKTVKTNLSSKNQTGPVVIGISRDHQTKKSDPKVSISILQKKSCGVFKFKPPLSKMPGQPLLTPMCGE